MDSQGQDGPGVKILFVFYSSSSKNALDKQLCVHLPDNATSAFPYLYSTEILYQDLCAKGITSPLPASEGYAVIFVDNWVISSSSPCVYNM